MATIPLLSGTRTYTNTAASDDYVMRFGSLSDITAFTGSYVINATTPTAGNLFPQDGADKYVIELVNIVDPVTGQPKWPLVFPALALTSATANGNQLIGDNVQDTLTLRWLDQRSGGPLTVTINGFDATGKGTGLNPPTDPNQRDSVQVRVIEGTTVTAVLDQRFDQFWTASPPANSTFALKSYTVEESVSLNNTLLDLEESPLISIVLQDNFLSANAAESAFFTSNFSSNYSHQVHEFAGTKTWWFEGGPTREITSELIFTSQSLAGAGRAILSVPESIGQSAQQALTSNYWSSLGQLTAQNSGTSVPDIRNDVLIDAAATGALTLSATGTSYSSNWDKVSYAIEGITSSGKAGLVGIGSSPPSSYGPMNLSTRDGGFNDTGANGGTYDVKVLRSNGQSDVFDGFESFLLSSNNDVVDLTYNSAAGANNWWSVDGQAGSDQYILRSGNNSVAHLSLSMEEESVQSNAVYVNLSGIGRSVTVNGITTQLASGDANVLNGQLTSQVDGVNQNTATAVASGRVVYGEVLDAYGSKDSVQFAATSGVLSDNFGISFDGTASRDRFWFAADGMGAVANYQVQASTGIDVINFYAKGGGTREENAASVNMTAGSGGLNDAYVLGKSLFNVGGTGPATGTDSYTLTVAAGPSNGFVTVNLTRGGTAVDSQVLAQTTKLITFEDDPGRFHDLQLFIDNSSGLAAGQTYTFTVGDNSFDFTDFGSASPSSPRLINQYDLSNNGNLASLQLSYQWEADYGPMHFFNSLVDKGAGYGFDRIGDHQDLVFNGLRNYQFGSQNDFIFQTGLLRTTELRVEAGDGSDKFFYRAQSEDSNELVTFNLGEAGQASWGGNGGYGDGDVDQLEIDVSALSADHRSVQYLVVTGIDSGLDTIKFVDTSGYFIERRDTAGMTKYSVYDGNSAVAANLVLDVRVGNQPYSLSTLDGSAGATGGTILTGARSIYAADRVVSKTAGNDEALLFENESSQPHYFLAGNDYVVSMGGDIDVALGDGNDFISMRGGGVSFVSGGAGNDQIGLAGGVIRDASGNLIADQWSFSSISVATVKELLAAKYPTYSVTTDPFGWSSGTLDLVMQATNRLDGSTIFFQTETIGFSDGQVIASEAFLPAQSNTLDFTSATAVASQDVFGRRSTEDVVTFRLAAGGVDKALASIGTWLDSTVTSVPSATGGVLGGSHTLTVKAGNQFYAQGSALTAGAINLVDVETINLMDTSGRSVSIRIAGSNGYGSVSEAISRANRGDVIYIAESREVITGSTVSAAAMETTVNMTAGLRVAFEEGANRTTHLLPTGATLTVNMTDQNMAAGGAGVTGNNFFGGARAIELLGTAAVNLNGSNLDDLIIGNRGANTIAGGAGRDIIFGGYGADILLGQAGNDVVIGGSPERVVGMSWTADEGTAVQWGNAETRLDSVNQQTWFDMGVGVGDLRVGDKLTYNFSGGNAPTVMVGTTSSALTNGQALFVVGIDTTAGSPSYGWVKLATTATGAALKLVSEGTSNNFSFTLENTVWTDTNRPGNDYAVGGSGDDTMVAVGVVGSSATVRDTLTLSGGSGDDTFKLFGSTGQINIMGGSGSDTVMATSAFGETNTLNGARVFDFSATQDTVMGQFDGTAGALSSVGGIEGRLQLDGLRLSQLVAPPLPIVNGSGENGNYERLTSQDNAATNNSTNQTFALGSETINLADILNQHLAHA